MSKKKKAVSVYFYPDLLERIKKHSSEVGVRQFNRIVNDACERFISDIERSKTLVGHVYAVYSKKENLVKVGASSCPEARIPNVVTQYFHGDSCDVYVSDEVVNPKLWEEVSHFELIKKGFHHDRELFVCGFDDAKKIIESCRPSSERLKKYGESGTGRLRAFSVMSGIPSDKICEIIGLYKNVVGSMMKDDVLFEDIRSFVLQKFNSTKGLSND